jgi:fumarate hydratase subunit alpha
MEENLAQTISNTIINLYMLAETRLPFDVVDALKKAYDGESNPRARSFLGAILRNIDLSRELGKPMCQDTGVPTFYIELGEDFPLKKRLEDIIIGSTRLATNKVPLRPNSVNPFSGENSGDNTGRFIPFIHWDIVEGDNLRITLLPKGGGSENTVQLRMLSPGLGIKGIRRAVIETVYEAGGKPCPPIIVGVGIGGGADIALILAKKALLRPLNERHSESSVARFEEELLGELNELGIGPMGLGGDTTVLGVNIEYAYRHPASLPVGIATQCWAARRATAIVHRDGYVEFVSHKGVDIDV